MQARPGAGGTPALHTLPPMERWRLAGPRPALAAVLVTSRPAGWSEFICVHPQWTRLAPDHVVEVFQFQGADSGAGVIFRADHFARQLPVMIRSAGDAVASVAGLRMRQNRYRRNRRRRGESWQFRRSAASTIAMNAGRPAISSATILLQAASAVSRRANPPGGTTERPWPTGYASQSARRLHATGFPAALRLQAGRTQLRPVPDGISGRPSLPKTDSSSRPKVDYNPLFQAPWF